MAISQHSLKTLPSVRLAAPRRKGHHVRTSSSAWKIAFADFCMVLMCLFVVLWVLDRRANEVHGEVAPVFAKSQGGNATLPPGVLKPSLDTSLASDAVLQGTLHGQYETPADLVRLAQHVLALSERGSAQQCANGGDATRVACVVARYRRAGDV